MNKNLFQSASSKPVPTDTTNLAGGQAYSLTPEQALAQYAATGTLNGTFYAGAEAHLETLKALLAKVEDNSFLAKLAVYSRKSAYMKDMPAVILAELHRRGALSSLVFEAVLDNGKMLRNFVQAVRSGQFGRKSFGTRVKRLLQEKIRKSNPDWLFRNSIGASPSMGDILRMVHPKPMNEQQNALFAYLLGKEHSANALPQLVQDYEKFKAGQREMPPEVPHELLTSLTLTEEQWKQIFRVGGWHFTRMNLNTALRHGVLKDRAMVDLIAARLCDREAIQSAKVFPYQLLAAYVNASPEIPQAIRGALHDALEISVANIPEIPGNVHIAVDVSGSMANSITGNRSGSTSKVRCVDVAALIASSIFRRNPEAKIYPFDTGMYLDQPLEPRDTVMTNATRLAAYGGGGTNCSLVAGHLAQTQAKVDLLVYVSDNESWADYRVTPGGIYYRSTGLTTEWRRIKQKNPRAKLVLIDLVAGADTQARPDQDVLLVGGFSDQVYHVISSFLTQEGQADHWVKIIQGTEIPG